MSKYYGTYSCGHEGRVNIVGPTKDRQWKADRHFEKMCPECWEKHLEEQREKANKEAEEKAKEMELPQLIGSEKQVAWANTLRQKFIDLVKEIDEQQLIYAGYKHPELKRISLEELKIIEDYILINHTEAKYFIDNRYDDVFKYLARDAKEALKSEEQIVEEEIENKTELEVKAEATVKPENPVTEIASEITVKEDKVTVTFEKNDKFREIVKDLGYKWEGTWERKISEYTGKAEDRAAELGNKLLNAGFPIMILDETIRNNAIEGNYEQECDRWVLVRKEGTYAGSLVLKWWEKNDKLYKASRKLPGSKWDKGTIINISHYKEVEEFAELYDFKFSKAALKAIDEYKEAKGLIETVTPATVEEKTPKDGLQEILNSGSEILDDLKDETI